MRDADRGVLAFAAAHHLILTEQVALLLGTDADAARKRLALLQLAGLIRRTRMPAGDPGGYQITTAGLTAIASKLPPPRIDAERSRHDVALGWIWLAATKGETFGPVERVLSEREMRAHDTRPNPAGLEVEPRPAPRPTYRSGPSFGVPLNATELARSTGLHYPDLLLITSAGRVPIELELCRPAAERLGAIMSGYAAQPNIRGVLYMTDDQRVANAIQTVSDRLGISARIHLQRINIQAANQA